MIYRITLSTLVLGLALMPGCASYRFTEVQVRNSDSKVPIEFALMSNEKRVWTPLGLWGRPMVGGGSPVKHGVGRIYAPRGEIVHVVLERMVDHSDVMFKFRMPLFAKQGSVIKEWFVPEFVEDSGSAEPRIEVQVRVRPD